MLAVLTMIVFILICFLIVAIVGHIEKKQEQKKAGE